MMDHCFGICVEIACKILLDVLCAAMFPTSCPNPSKAKEENERLVKTHEKLNEAYGIKINNSHDDYYKAICNEPKKHVIPTQNITFNSKMSTGFSLGYNS